MRKQKSDAFTVLRVLQSVFEMMETLTSGCGIQVNNEVHGTSKMILVQLFVMKD